MLVDREHQEFPKQLLLSGQEHKRYYGMYRAIVLNNYEEPDTEGKAEKVGRIEVYIPFLMFDTEDWNDPKTGIYAWPVFPFGAQNQDMESKGAGEDPNREDYGSFIVPPKNSYVLVFFEDGDPNQCRYLPYSPTSIYGTPLYEVMNKPHPEKEFYLLKTPRGHRIFLSDNNDRIVARTYKNFFIEIKEKEEEKLPEDSEFDKPDKGMYIEIWAPEANPPKPFGSDLGPIGEGNESDDLENEDRDDCKGGQKATIKCKGGSGIHGSERTDGEKEETNAKIDLKKPNEIRDIRKKFLGVDDSEDPEKELGQKGNPIKGYRGEWCSHKDKQYIQLETSKKYLLYINQHEEDQFIKLLTERKYRFEMNQHEDEKYIQLETPENYHIYINCHDDDQFIRAMTDKQFRVELNQHPDNRWIQAETENHNIVELNDKDEFIRAETTNHHLIRMDDKEKYILIKSTNEHFMRIDDKQNYIWINTRNGNLIRLEDKGNRILISARQLIEIVAPTVVVDSPNVNLGGFGGARVITENSPCLFTGGPHTGGAATTKAV